jgi:stress-induced morphogen
LSSLDTNQIEKLLQESLGADAQIELKDLTGTGDHLQLKVRAEKFRGLPMIDQHRLVYGALGDLVKGAIHALMLETSAPE